MKKNKIKNQARVDYLDIFGTLIFIYIYRKHEFSFYGMIPLAFSKFPPLFDYLSTFSIFLALFSL